MKKIITIGKTEVELVSTALTSLAFKKIFDEDILQTIGLLRQGTKDSAEASTAVTDISRLAFVMNKQSTCSVKELMNVSELDYYEWLNDFERNDFYDPETITAVISAWSGNLATSVDAKNSEGAQQDR